MLVDLVSPRATHATRGLLLLLLLLLAAPSLG